MTARISASARFLPAQLAGPMEKGMNAVMFVCHSFLVSDDVDFSKSAFGDSSGLESHRSGWNSSG